MKLDKRIKLTKEQVNKYQVKSQVWEEELERLNKIKSLIKSDEVLYINTKEDKNG